MDTNAANLVSSCLELIRVYYSRNERMRLNDLEALLNDLSEIIKDEYPYYCEVLREAMSNFNQSPHHNMGCITCILKLIKKEETGEKSKKIFISHSSKDKDMAQNFVDNILQLGIGINHDDIFCTSVESMSIKTGEDIRKHIKLNLKHCDFVFLIISENYNNSGMCLNEMGAAWALERNVIPLLLFTTFEKLPWLYTPNIASQLNEDDTLNKLYDILTEKYSIPKNATKWGKYKTEFFNKLK